MRKVNFSPGPAAVPFEVLTQIQQELLDWQSSGVSVMEISHRSDAFLQLHNQLQVNLRKVFNIPKEHEILLMPGGARGQFSAIPLNLTRSREEGGKAVYLISGYWSAMAERMARNITSTTSVLFDDKKFLIMPEVDDAELTAAYKDNYNSRQEDEAQLQTINPGENDKWQEKGDYFHYCHNETIDGIMLPEIPQAGNLPIVADVSSCIAACPLDFSRFDLAYACAQKNLGVAGITFVSISRELLNNKARKETPGILNYQTMHECNSLFNTPNTFAEYVCNLVCEWIIDKGGILELSKINQRKANALYKTIDESDGFYVNHITPEYRSLTNVVFELADKSYEEKFIKDAADNGFINLKGHKILGGIRASIYNAMREEDVMDFCSFMKDFRH